MHSKITTTSIVVGIFFLLLLLGLPTIMFTDAKQGKVTLNEKVTLPFKVDENTDVVLLYFGYVGCRTICVPSLEEIAKIYSKIDDRSKVSFYFINISEDETQADRFAKYFHKEFVGLQLPKKDVSSLMTTLRAYSSDPLIQGGDIYHTGYLYLITKSKINDLTLKNMYYTRPFNEESIILDIKEELE